MTDLIIDLVVALLLKLALLFGFIFGLRYWHKRKQNKIPIILYWIFGVICVLMISSQIFEWFLITTLFKEGSYLRDLDSLEALSALLGIVLYIYIGTTQFKKSTI